MLEPESAPSPGLENSGLEITIQIWVSTRKTCLRISISAAISWFPACIVQLPRAKKGAYQEFKYAQWQIIVQVDERNVNPYD